MSPELLENCRNFYASCILRGRIPVCKWGRRWHYSSDPEAFEDYLSRFKADDRGYIIKTVGHPRTMSANRISAIVSSLHKDKVAELVAILRKKDPDAFNKAIDKHMKRLEADGRL